MSFKTYCVMEMYCIVPSTFLSLISLIDFLMTALGGMYYYCPHLTDKETETQVEFSQQGLDPGFDLRGVTPDPELFIQTQSSIEGGCGQQIQYCFLPLAFLNSSILELKEIAKRFQKEGICKGEISAMITKRTDNKQEQVGFLGPAKVIP